MDEKIKKLRLDLDVVDDSLVDLLEKRIKLGKEIVSLKRRSGAALDDFSRELEIKRRLSRRSPDLSDLIDFIYRGIFDWVKNR